MKRQALQIDQRKAWGCALPPLSVQKSAVRKDAVQAMPMAEGKRARAAGVRSSKRAARVVGCPGVRPKAAPAYRGAETLDAMIAALSHLGGLNVTERERFARRSGTAGL